jgi:hypothetical protein
MNNQTGKPVMLSEFLHLLRDHFSLEELRNLCFELMIDFAELGGEGKTAKCRELIIYLGRRHRLNDLTTLVEDKRPQVKWPILPPWPRDITSWPQALEHEAFTQTVMAYREYLRAQAVTTEPVHVPYKELHPFEIGDAHIFFGREQAVATMIELIEHDRLTILHGDPGIGKTSLIRAGLIPRLLGGDHFPISVRVGPGDPVMALKRLLQRDLQQTPTIAQASLRDFLHKVSDVFADQMTLFVFFDQFEEFFTQNLTPEAQMHFVMELGECLDDHSLPVCFILALQDKYVGRISTFRPHVEVPLANEYLLLPLTHDEARLAVTEPLRQVNGRFEENLVHKILADFKAEAILPAHLQLLCGAIYKQQMTAMAAGDPLLITAAAYEALGGLEGVLQDRLERVLTRELPEEQRLTAQKVLSVLVTNDGQRDQKSEAELSILLHQVGIAATSLGATLEALIHSGLLYRLQIGEMGEKEVYELAHDYLIDEIKPWIDVDQHEAKHVYSMLAQGHVEYKDHKRLFDVEQLDIVAQQLTNIYLNLSEADYRFLLISATCRGLAVSTWLEKIGALAPEWLREFQQQTSNPEPWRLAAVTVLGQLEDEETFLNLSQQVTTPDGRSYGARALAHFIYGSHQKRAYPVRLWWLVERPLAKLQFQPYREKLAVFRRAAGYAGAIGAVTGVVDLFQEFLPQYPAIAFALLLLFPAIGFFLAQSWGGMAGRIWVVFSRKNTAVRVLAFMAISIAMGFVTMLFVALENFGWAVGIAIGFLFPVFYRFRASTRLMRWLIAVLSAGLMVLTALGALAITAGANGLDLSQRFVSLWATGVFGVIFTRQITLHLFPIARPFP